MYQPPIIAPSKEDLIAAEARLAEAKDSDDACQAALRLSKGAATAAKKELATALRGWRQLVRQIEQSVDAEDAEEADDIEDSAICQECGCAKGYHEAACSMMHAPDEPDPNEEQGIALEQLLDNATEPIAAGRRRR